MESVELAALAAAGGRYNSAKSEIAPGETNIDMTVRIKGVLKKSADTVKANGTKAAKIDWEYLIYLALKDRSSEEVQDLFDRYKSVDEDRSLYESAGGGDSVYKDVCSYLNVAPYEDAHRAGSVTMKDLVVLRLDIGESTEASTLKIVAG